MTEKQVVLALIIRNLGLTQSDWMISYEKVVEWSKPKTDPVKVDLDKVINDCANEMRI